MPPISPLASRPTPIPDLPAGSLSDEEIVARVVAGETELFELLMRRHNQSLFRILRGVADRAADAEDLLQDAWVKAFQHLASFRGEARFSTWVARIAIHEAGARARRGRRFEALSPSVEDALRAPRGEEPQHRAETTELRGLLEAAIDGLSPALRAVLVLRDVEGLSTADTATTLDLSVEAVKVRLHRARAALRRELDRSLGGAMSALYSFDGDRCDRVVAGVWESLGLHRLP
jgi:RNA polymerase sigma-70 factor, ECF subfamily